MSSYGFCAGNSKGAGSIGYEYEVAPTIRGGRAGRTRFRPSYSFKWFQGKAAHGIGWFEEQTPTIVGADGHVPAVVMWVE